MYIKSLLYGILIAVCITVPSIPGSTGGYTALWTKYHTQYPKLTRPVFEAVCAAAHMYKLDHALILAVIDAESGFRPGARSHANARGLMQVMPLWYDGHADDLYRPRLNILLGSKILQQYMQEADNNLLVALKFYNAGPHGSVWNGPYIVKIMHNIARSHPDLTMAETIGI